VVLAVLGEEAGAVLTCRECGRSPTPGSVMLFAELDLCSDCGAGESGRPTLGTLDLGELGERKRAFDGKGSDEAAAQRVVDGFLATGKLP
jgi:hypothetical protein